MTDEELLKQYAAEGSQQCFAELVRRHTDAVYACCVHILGNRHDAEDAVQATFLVLARKAPKLSRVASLGGWLFRVASHCARTLKRKLARQGRHEREASMGQVGSQAPRESALVEELRPYLDLALAALPASERDVAVLRFFYEKTEAEIGREVGCTQQAVSLRMSGALEKLRRSLCRQGVALSAGTLAACLGQSLAIKAPAGLVASVQAVCLGQAAAAPTVLSLTKGALRTMFWTKAKLVAAVVGTLVCMAGGGMIAAQLAAAEAPPRTSAGGSVTVLNNDSCLRSHLVFKTPVMVGKDGQIKPVPDPKPKASGSLPEFQSPLPPADWIKPDFDDVLWEKDRAPIEAGPENDRNRYAGPSNSLICVRARFTVEDPARVQDLKLSLEYVGGVVVHVNGQEAARGHMPSGEVKPDTLAEKYPDDLYCEPDGTFTQVDRSGKLANPAGFGRRFRKVADVAVPAKLLRKGSNVLAIEVHRAAINEAAIGAKRVAVGSMNTMQGIWAYAGLKDLKLTAAAGSALVPNIERPKGIQVWNCTPAETVTAFDYGDGGPLRPVVIAAPRNAVLSGRLAVSSDQAIKGLKVEVSDLVSAGGGKLPAAAVRVRCAEAGIPLPMSKGQVLAFRYNALLEAIPAEIPVVKASPPKGYAYYPINYLRAKYNPGPMFPVDRSSLTGGAVAPIWLTVRVPKDLAPGAYQGTVTVSAAGLPATPVALKLVVSAWTQPDPQDFRIVNFGQQSPDSLARHYDVPLWSDRHFELMGRSMALMAELNSRQATVELAHDFYGVAGNQDTMVRWIKQADGSFKYDFTIMDKYLDTVAKHMGKPALLRLNCWEDVKKKDGKLVENRGIGRTGGTYRVTTIDPATGKLGSMDQPLAGTEESFAFWKPVLDQIRKKVEARGWWDVTAMGFNSYHIPALPEVVSVYNRIWPDGVWSWTSHAGSMGAQWSTTDKSAKMLVRYSDVVWNKLPAKHRGARELLKPRPGFFCYTFRTEFHDFDELFLIRDIPEEEITCGHDGLSDFGVDFFPFKADNGKMTTVGCGRGTGGPENSTMALLAPGRDGPMPTERYEALREGVELGEAIIFLERSLLEKKIGGELEARVNRYLDERSEAYMKRWPSGRAERDRKLIELAGEVAAQLNK